MRISLALIAFFTTSLAFAQTDEMSSAKKKYCDERMASPDAIQKIISNTSNQLSMINQGGLFGAGVCWWHSRFTRAAAYLAVFDPSLPRPTNDEAKDIISHLRKRKGVITIPGFKDLQEFSIYHREEIQSKLGDWQRTDGIMKASWVKGLKGNSAVDPADLQKKMDSLFERISNGETVFQTLQMPGIVAHSWLVTGMSKEAEGYKLTVVDSNFGGTDTYYYRSGMREFTYEGSISFVPYTSQNSEEEKLKSKMLQECMPTDLSAGVPRR